MQVAERGYADATRDQISAALPTLDTFNQIPERHMSTLPPSSSFSSSVQDGSSSVSACRSLASLQDPSNLNPMTGDCPSHARRALHSQFDCAIRSKKACEDSLDSVRSMHLRKPQLRGRWRTMLVIGRFSPRSPHLFKAVRMFESCLSTTYSFPRSLPRQQSVCDTRHSVLPSRHDVYHVKLVIGTMAAPLLEHENACVQWQGAKCWYLGQPQSYRITRLVICTRTCRIRDASCSHCYFPIIVPGYIFP